MKRTVITVCGNGMLSIPSNLENLWMSEGELVDMLHVTAPKLNYVIRAIYKEGMLLMSEVQQRQELSKGIWQTLYGFPYELLPFASVSPLMVQRNFVMPSSRGCTEQKRKQPLSCNFTEGQMLLVENGRIFDAWIFTVVLTY